MAALYRIASAFLLALTLVMLWSPAHASFAPYSSGTEYANQAWAGTANQWFPTREAACALSAQVSGFTLASISGNKCNWTNGNGSTSLATRTAPASCPANSTGTSSCTCNAGYAESGSPTACVYVPTVCENYASGGAEYSLTFRSASPLLGTRTVCSADASGNACLYSGQTEYCGLTPAGDWKCEMSSSHATGAACMPAPSPSTPSTSTSTTPTSYPPTTAPPAGKCPGEVNGVTVYVDCVDPSTNKTVTSTMSGTATTSTPNGSTSTVGTSTSTSTTTACQGDVCTKTTVTTISTNVGGSVTSTNTTVTGTSTRSDFCRDNPIDKACGKGGVGEDSSFTGACAAGFQCSGDAIMCAVSREQHRRNCALFDTPTPESAAYDSVKALTGNQTTALPGNESKAINSGSFNSSDAIGGAVCIGDKVVTVAGHSLSLPFSSVCPWLSYLKTILLAVSYLSAAGIVFRRA